MLISRGSYVHVQGSQFLSKINIHAVCTHHTAQQTKPASEQEVPQTIVLNQQTSRTRKREKQLLERGRVPQIKVSMHSTCTCMYMYVKHQVETILVNIILL